MPAAVFLSAERLKIRLRALEADLHADAEEARHLEDQLLTCLEVLRTIQKINNLGIHYLEILRCNGIC
jgi:hypothetical protein